VSALYELEKKFSNVYYFPSFEIMMDELRDYRFYTSDMAHPNETAVTYIWERFLESCISDRSREFIKKFAPVDQAKKHHLSADSDQNQTTQFALSMLKKINDIKEQFPEIDVGSEICWLNGLRNDADISLS